MLTGLTWSYIAMEDFSAPGTMKLAVQGSRTSSPEAGGRSSIWWIHEFQVGGIEVDWNGESKTFPE